jgi:hypothetical protein
MEIGVAVASGFMGFEFMGRGNGIPHKCEGKCVLANVYT